MPSLHIIKNHKTKYFLTLRVLEWIDIFTNESYYQLLADSLNFCIREKGLVINGYAFMTNHIHLIADTKDKPNLQDIIRDFKRHTTKEIIKLLRRDNRKYIKGLLVLCFKKKAKNKLQIWRPSNWPVICDEPDFYNQKLDYIHNNPIEKGYVDNPCNWKYSSASDYYTKEKSPVRVTTE